MSIKGTVLRAEVTGTIKLKCLLTGMPECKLGMNDKLLMEKEPKKAGVTTSDKGITIDDMKFHQCVKLPKFDKERSITFIPPDGSCDLMEYLVNENSNLPFKVIPLITQINQQKMEVRLKLKSIFDKTLNANNVVVKIPCPKNTASVNCNTLVGRAKYEPENGAIVWRLKKFPGDFECFLQCEVQLGVSSKDQVWVRPPISMDFVVPMFTASGLRVRFLRVYEKSGYKPNKLHRAMTKAGEYQHRI